MAASSDLRRCATITSRSKPSATPEHSGNPAASAASSRSSSGRSGCPRLLRVAFITTLVSGLLFAGLWAAIRYGLLDLEALIGRTP